jgi:hypothetical protein
MGVVIIVAPAAVQVQVLCCTAMVMTRREATKSLALTLMSPLGGWLRLDLDWWMMMMMMMMKTKACGADAASGLVLSVEQVMEAATVYHTVSGSVTQNVA